MNPEVWFVSILGGGTLISVAFAYLEKSSKKHSSGSTVHKRTANVVKQRKKQQTTTTKPINRAELRSDDVILSLPINELSAKEFERLWALYFRDYKHHRVEEPGQKGDDGGVDIVYTDRKNVRTAVQCKHWPSRTVGPDVMRELKASKGLYKPSCHYGLLITSGEVSRGARELAHDLAGLEYWHGGTLENRLSKWDKWRGGRKTRVKQ